MLENNSLVTHRNPGAQVLQATLGTATAVFYLSPLSAPDAPARGGVPVLFPQFAEWGPLAKHGFVRNKPWRLVADTVQDGTQHLHYELDIGAADEPTWAHAASLRLTVKAARRSLVFSLQVRNTGQDAFSWSGGLHPYFAVTDVLASSLSGLAGLGVQDRYNPSLARQPAGDLTWTEEAFERLYSACPPLRLQAGAHSLELNASGFDQWMVWNPGEAGAQALADLPAPEWRRFVCVEPVCVNQPVLLAPGAEFEGHMTIALCEP